MLKKPNLIHCRGLVPKLTKRGFALVATISMMVLLVLVAMGMLSLSTVSLRQGGVNQAEMEARSNARMALMIAIGELQSEMGPDMRISAQAAIHDKDPTTEAIEGIAQPHWMAVYDSWGDWLNGEYTPEGSDSSDVSAIVDTYDAKRSAMFRRWMVSLPEQMQADVDAAETILDENESVVMVGPGTLGMAHAESRPEKVTRAYKIPVGERGASAWWVSPENHKAKINLAAQSRSLSADRWATSQGVTAEVGIGGIEGMDQLDTDNAGAAQLARRLITLKTLGIPAEARAQELFFDLTDDGFGVLSNTRSGGLKKDLSLLFENNDTTIAPQYTQAALLYTLEDLACRVIMLHMSQAADC